MSYHEGENICLWNKYATRGRTEIKQGKKAKQDWERQQDTQNLFPSHILATIAHITHTERYVGDDWNKTKDIWNKTKDSYSSRREKQQRKVTDLWLEEVEMQRKLQKRQNISCQEATTALFITFSFISYHYSCIIVLNSILWDWKL